MTSNAFVALKQVALVVAACLLDCWLPPASCGSDPLSPTQPYMARTASPVTHDVELVVAVTAPYKTNVLRVWMPIPQSDNVQEVVNSEITTFPVPVRPQIATESVFGNKFAYFEFQAPQGAVVIRHALQIKVCELHWDIDPERVQAVSTWSDEFFPYLRGEEQAIVVDGRFETLLAEIVPTRSNPLRDLGAVMDFIDGSFTYDHRNASLRASSIHALEQRTGHCSDYHGFCAAMGRRMRVPTRVTYGINTFPKASPSHCKLEAFLPPYGWVSFDISETQKMASLIRKDATLDDASKERLIAASRARLMGGFRDNTWFKQTQGTDYELVPKARHRVPVVRTIYAEADGVPLADPDPSAAGETKFSWMTAHRFESVPPAKNPFVDTSSLHE